MVRRVLRGLRRAVRVALTAGSNDFVGIAVQNKGRPSPCAGWAEVWHQPAGPDKFVGNFKFIARTIIQTRHLLQFHFDVLIGAKIPA